VISSNADACGEETMTTTARTTLFASLVALLAVLLATTACRDQLPCPDCDEKADEQDDDQDDDEPLPDLPCGGADLLTDNLNCGSCGHECVLWDAGTPYESGGCIEGQCGPRWTYCQAGGFPGGFSNCSEICTALGETCVPDGCAGYTAALYDVDFDGHGCDPKTSTPAVTMTGDCDEPIPWASDDDESMREVKCCCDFQ